MFKKFLVFFVLVFSFVIFAGLSFPSCSKNDTATPETTETGAVLPSEPLAAADVTSLDSTITGVYEGAEAKAKEWKSDANLYLVSVKVPSDLSLNSSTLTYAYGSTNVPNDWWTYSWSEATNKYVRALVPKEDYLGEIASPINRQYWRTNYVEAFQIAQANGGATFRKANKNATVVLSLSQSEPKGWLWWTVEYKTGSGDSLKVRINPNDKTVVDDNGNVISASSTYGNTATTPAATTTTSGL